LKGLKEVFENIYVVMRFSALLGTIFLASTILAGPHVIRDNDDDDDDHIRIFQNANERWSAY
jgi:hypothetical protein